MRLYDFSNNYQRVLDMIDSGQEGLEDTLESIEEAFEDKVENIAKLIRTLSAEIEGIKSEEKRLAERRISLVNNIKRLKSYTEDSMQAVGKRKIKGSLFTVYIKKNPPSVEVINNEVIPEKYLVPVEPKLDKKAIIADSKEGEKVPGVQIRQSEGLQIR